jgi:hypothetical protein
MTAGPMVSAIFNGVIIIMHSNEGVNNQFLCIYEEGAVGFDSFQNYLISSHYE